VRLSAILAARVGEMALLPLSFELLYIRLESESLELTPSTTYRILKALLHSFYPKYNVIEILIRISIITTISKTLLYLFNNHASAIMLTMDSIPQVPIVPDIICRRDVDLRSCQI
jgi:hypothetical protein